MPCDQDTPPVRCVKGQRVTGASRERLRAEVARGYSQDLSIAELAERF
ncbi:helix-turn-helix domain-containing protein, partial [Kibdelosporangium lantanae]